jgi:phytoene dehydrogenase-like protein
MPEELDHGPRLTDEEYEKGIIELHRGLPPMPTEEQDRQVRRKALDLAIDHRLGRDFPPERRELLWAIQQRVEKRRLWLALAYPFRRFFAKSLARGAQGLAGYLVDEYAKVLTPTELENFFSLEEGQRPGLPIDLDQLKGPRSGR